MTEQEKQHPDVAAAGKEIAVLSSVHDPIGPDNDRHLESIMRDADVHIVAWGSLQKLPAKLRDRWLEVVHIASKVGCQLQCFSQCIDKHPRHPLMLPYGCVPYPWLIG